jgi:glucose-6-phosphate 1-dehydrogenase
MDDSEQLDELMVCRLDHGPRELLPCTIVIFGASGDLTARKLIPALYHLFGEGHLPEPFRVVGVARREKTDASWREELLAALKRFSRTQPVDVARWEAFAERLHYHRGDLQDPATYQTLRERLEGFADERLRRNLRFYLAISPR